MATCDEVCESAAGFIIVELGGLLGVVQQGAGCCLNALKLRDRSTAFTASTGRGAKGGGLWCGPWPRRCSRCASGLALTGSPALRVLRKLGRPPLRRASLAAGGSSTRSAGEPRNWVRLPAASAGEELWLLPLSNSPGAPRSGVRQSNGSEVNVVVSLRSVLRYGCFDLILAPACHARPAAPPHVLIAAVARVAPVKRTPDSADPDSGDLISQLDRLHRIQALDSRDVRNQEVLRAADVLGRAVRIQHDGVHPPIRLLRQIRLVWLTRATRCCEGYGYPQGAKTHEGPTVTAGVGIE